MRGAIRKGFLGFIFTRWGWFYVLCGKDAAKPLVKIHKPL
jgi:hypothetical protein